MMAPTNVDDVPEFLLQTISALRDSPEYERLDERSRLVPGLVLGQVTILARRLQSEAMDDNVSRTVLIQLNEIFSTLEVLARSPSPEVQNLVVVEVLEHLHGPDEVRTAILAKLGPSTRQLYRTWVDPPPDGE